MIRIQKEEQDEKSIMAGCIGIIAGGADKISRYLKKEKR
jgi:hypothetical protein